MKKYSLRGIGLVGIIIFLPIFVFTLLDPNFVERSGRGFIEWKVKDEAEKRIESIRFEDTLSESRLVKRLLNDKANEKLKEIEAQLEEVKEQLKNDAPRIISERIAEMRNLDCECRNKWEERLRSSMESSVASLSVAKQKLVDFTQGKYMEVLEKLTMDVRIFSGTNAVVFLFLFLLSLMKPTAINHLFLPGGLIAISTGVCSFFYIFEQNWLYTIIYNDYTGFAYIGYLVFVFALLCDIVFNRGRITTEMLNMLFNALGSAASFVPC
jgi:hypothetical protein